MGKGSREARPLEWESTGVENEAEEPTLTCLQNALSTGSHQRTDCKKEEIWLLDALTLQGHLLDWHARGRTDTSGWDSDSPSGAVSGPLKAGHLTTIIRGMPSCSLASSGSDLNPTHIWFLTESQYAELSPGACAPLTLPRRIALAPSQPAALRCDSLWWLWWVPNPLTSPQRQAHVLSPPSDGSLCS